MSASLRDKVVVITGATRGFGYAIAEAMLKAGASVVISGRSLETLQGALATLGTLGTVSGKTCDVREEQQVYALARFAVQAFGRIDIWINNAGYSSPAGLMLEMHPDQAVDLFLTNDMGTLYGTQAALHYMLPRREGTLVNIYGNGSFLRPASPTGLYGATKAWLTSFTRSLSKEIAGSGVRLIGFSPGMLLTDMLTHPAAIGERGKEMMKNYSFVLKLLADPPEQSAWKLVETVANNNKHFVEYRALRPGTMLIRLLRMLWREGTKTGKAPEYTVTYEDPYQPKIEEPPAEGADKSL
jgi:NAD(P)-dependent dehydrogenase (short-subunit alcohol dehydrogenase family)